MSFISPRKSRLEQQTALVNVSGTKLSMTVPKIREIPRHRLHIPLIAPICQNVSFTRSAPYAMPAAKVSTHRAQTSSNILMTIVIPSVYSG